MGAATRFQRALQLLLLLHVGIVLMYRASVDFVYDAAPAVWILMGFYTEIRRCRLLLAAWGFLSAICIGTLCVVYPLRMPELMIAISERMGESRNVGHDVAEILLSCVVWFLYVATACMCVRLAFQLRAHTEAREAMHRSQHATDAQAPQCAEQETQRCGDATYILVPTTLDV